MIRLGSMAVLLLGTALLVPATAASAGSESPGGVQAIEGASELRPTDVGQAAQPASSPVPEVQAVRPAQQQAGGKQLFLNPGSGPSENRGTVRPGDELSLGLVIQNRGLQPEEYVLTVALPPEQSLISLEGLSARCEGTVCRGTVGVGPTATVNLALRTRLSSSYAETATAVRSELQEDANPDPIERIAIDGFSVEQSGKRLQLAGSVFGPGFNVPFRPGDETSFGFSVRNPSQQDEEFVITVTLPPELTLVGPLRSGDAAPLDCNGNVCRGRIAGGESIENQTGRTMQGRVRLATSFRGDTTSIQGDLQEDANPDPDKRTSTLTLPVMQPAAAAPSSGAATGGTLPRTGERTVSTALVALSLLLIGAIAQILGNGRAAGRTRG